MTMLKNADPKTRKVVYEVLVLLVVLIGVLVYFSITSQPDAEEDLPEPSSGIETDFDIWALEYVQERDSEEDGSRPILSDDAGKPNPFSF